MPNSKFQPIQLPGTPTFPDDAQAWLERGRQLAAQGQGQQAWACYERALTLNPCLTEALQAMSRLSPPKPTLS